MRMDKFTSNFQKALADAQSLAVGRDHNIIEPVHVLAALLDQAGGSSRPLLAQAGVNVPLLRERLGEALDATGICPHSTAHDRFQEWVEAGVWIKLWQVLLEEYDELEGLDWSYLSVDGSMTKAPLATVGEKKRAQPDGSRQARGQTQRSHGDRRRTGRGDSGRSQS